MTQRRRLKIERLCSENLKLTNSMTLTLTTRGPVSFGKILVQRDEKTALPHCYYSKLPSRISNDGECIISCIHSERASITNNHPFIGSHWTFHPSRTPTRTHASNRRLDHKGNRRPRRKRRKPAEHRPGKCCCVSEGHGDCVGPVSWS